MGTGRILIIDDEPFTLEAAASVLRGVGHEVHTCEQWAGAARMIRTTQPDLILLDYNMPALKGDNVCTILKRTMADSVPPILIHSSEPEDEVVQIVGRCGADGYVRKNLGPSELLRRVAEQFETTGTGVSGQNGCL
jgi:DNA-binding response OmpR family regulator